MGILMFSAILVLVGNLLADLLFAVADPRIRLELRMDRCPPSPAVASASGNRGAAVPAPLPPPSAGRVRRGHDPLYARLRSRALSHALRRALHRHPRALRAAFTGAHIFGTDPLGRDLLPACSTPAGSRSPSASRDADQHGHRHRDRRRRRLLRRPDRCRADAHRRCDAVLPEHLPAAGAGGLRPAEPAHDHRHHRASRAGWRWPASSRRRSARCASATS